MMEKEKDSPPLVPFQSPWNNLYFFFFFNSIITCIILPVVSSISFHDNGIFQYVSVQFFLYSLSFLYLLTAWGSFFFELLGRKDSKIADRDENNQNRSSNGIQKLNKNNNLLITEAVMVLSCELFFALFLILRSIPNKKCRTSNFILEWECNPYQSVPLFPLDTALILMVLPSIFSILTKCQKKEISLLLSLITLFSLVFSAVILSSVHSIPVIFIYILMTIVASVDDFYQLQYIERLYSSLHQYYDEKRQSAEKKKVDEMKDVIGNVSHDLKTPLASLMQGVDILSKEMRRVQARIPREVSECKELKTFFEETKAQFKNMRNTNVFMMMTINRVIDFAKATKGLNLLPKLDTIDLTETLNLPLNCMKNIQDRVNIKLIPLDKNTIHNFLITDKQWLQENILCLLSNAVKYSNGGEVTVTVSWQRTARYNNDPQKVFLSSRENSDRERSFVRNRTKLAGDVDFRATTTKGKAFSDIEEGGYRPRLISLTDRIFSCFHSSIMSGSRSSNYAKSTPSTVNSIVRSFRSVLRSQISQITPEFLLFEVEDTGIGMSEEVMQSLFSPFKQAQRLAGGTGLGLYSLSKRIEALNGQYGVRKRKDGKEGSLFWFTIPYRPDLSMEASHDVEESISMTRSDSGDNFPQLSVAAPSHMLVHSHSVPSLKKMISYSTKTVENVGNASQRVKPLHILLVEDSPTISKMTSLMLKRSGYEVTIASNGYSGLQFMTASYEAHNKTLIDALEKVQEKIPATFMRNDSTITILNGVESCSNIQTQFDSPSLRKSTIFDLVLMDFQMPIMDGFEATKRYREIEKQGNSSFQMSLPPTIAATITEYHLPIIGLTATSDQETIQHGLDAGLDDYLLKPLCEENLKSKIQKYFSLLQIANHHPATFNSSLL